MPIAHKTDIDYQKKIDASNKLNTDAIETLSDISRRITPDASFQNNVPNQNTSVGPTQASEEETSSKKYSDTVLVRLSKGKRSIYKSFFSMYGLTMNSGIEMSIEFLKEMVESGEIRISKAGAQKIKRGGEVQS